MKKVFVLIGDMGYDGSVLMGVYSSKELAQEAFGRSKDTKYLKCVIAEKEVDAEAKIEW